jgi:putative ABC transport system substrate-binding protein
MRDTLLTSITVLSLQGVVLARREAVRRREFIKMIGGGAVAWPLAARAQRPTMPVIGFLNVESPKRYAGPLAAFLKGLGETGFMEGRSVVIEYRWGEEHTERLPELVADLIHQQVSVIAATSTPASIAAKAATATIPVVFETSSDPIRLGLVSRLNRPGGNVTGVTQINAEVLPKRLELMRELLPGVTEIAVLINQADPALAEGQLKDIQAAAITLGVKLHVFNASTDVELEAAFVEVSHLRAGLVISTDPFFTSRPTQLAALAARYAVPAIPKGRSSPRPEDC